MSRKREHKLTDHIDRMLANLDQLESDCNRWTPDEPKDTGFDIWNERTENWRSLIRFGQKAFPQWVSDKCSSFHRYLDLTARHMVTSTMAQQRVDLAPRGNAKSTWISKILIAFIICHQEEIEAERGDKLDFILLTSNAMSLPIAFIRDIRRELETNQYLRLIYPHCCGRGDDKWTESLIKTRNGVWVLAGSTGKSIRGALQAGSRPKLIVCDDLENSENVQTLGQRDKIANWFDDDLLPAGDPNCHVWCLGTPLHRDSLLMRLKRKFDGRRFQSVIRWSANSKLWRKWQEMYLDLEGERGSSTILAEHLFKKVWPLLEPYSTDTNYSVDDEAEKKLNEFGAICKHLIGEESEDRLLHYSLTEAMMFVTSYGHLLPGGIVDLASEWEGCVLDLILRAKSRQAAAWTFYQDNREKMLEGTSVLWEEHEDYYHLMCQLAEATNVRSFYQEKQCQPRTTEEQAFPESVWRFYTAPGNPGPQDMRAIFGNGEDQAVFVGAVDPSMGKRNRRHDPAAIVILGGVPGHQCRICWSWIRREHPTKILERVYALHKIFQCETWAFESVQFQELFADIAVKDSEKMGLYLPVRKVTPTKDKTLRILGLEPLVSNGFIEYPARKTRDGARIPLFPVLWEQFTNFGEADVHDDGPDAMAMAFDAWKALETRKAPPLLYTLDERDVTLNGTSDSKEKRDYMSRMIRNTRQ